MSGPRVLLMTLSERTSARGMPYMSGWLGKANVVAFKADERDRYGNPQWELYVAEPQKAEPTTKNAERGQAGWDRSRNVTRHVERSSAQKAGQAVLRATRPAAVQDGPPQAWLDDTDAALAIAGLEGRGR